VPSNITCKLLTEHSTFFQLKAEFANVTKYSEKLDSDDHANVGQDNPTVDEQSLDEKCAEPSAASAHASEEEDVAEEEEIRSEDTNCQAYDDVVQECNILFSNPNLIDKFIKKNAPPNSTSQVSYIFTLLSSNFTFSYSHFFYFCYCFCRFFNPCTNLSYIVLTTGHRKNIKKLLSMLAMDLKALCRF
jgi:hypothetical protein